MIREANQKDSINLTALSIQVWLHTYATDGIRKELSSFVLAEFTKEKFLSHINNPDYRVLVAIKKDHLVGYIMLNLKSYWKDESNGFEIEKLYVQEHFQGTGLGRKLLSEVIKRYGDVFWLSTWVENKNGIGFYKHFGFVDVGRLEFRLGESETAENRVLAFKG
jgi:ribosomal protein S18 acetylase RimI-like enzyme